MAEDLLPVTRRALRHRVATAQSEGRVPALIGAVVRDGARVWTHGAGTVDGLPPTAATQYRIGSITKSLVAAQVLRLRDEGALELTDTLERHLPGTSAGGVTLFQLLAHTAGLRAETPGPWWERTPGTLRPTLPDLLGDTPQTHPAGHRHHYSNPGFALLGAVIEAHRGDPWHEVLRKELLEPLGMTATTFGPRPPHARGWAVHPWADVLQPEPAEDTGLMAPAGQLWSTAGDMCRWAAFLGAGNEAVLSASSVAEMRTPTSAPLDGAVDPMYGLGLKVTRAGGRLLAGHTGSMPGFLAAVWADPESGVGAAVLANATSGPLIGAVAADLVRIVVEHEPPFPPTWAPMAEADPALLALTGPWYQGPSPYTLRLERDRALTLTPQGPHGRGTRLRPGPAEGTWTGTDGYHAGETLRVVRRPDGTVSHLDLGSFVFTRVPYDPAAPVPGGTAPDGWRGGDAHRG